jgi:hypothetical protein
MKPKGTQLQMFMTPAEIKSHVVGSVDAPGRTPDERKKNMGHVLSGEKLERARRLGTAGEGDTTSMLESITKGGVQKPVIISDQGPNLSRGDDLWLGNGNHRVGAAEQAEKDTGKQQFIPVIHDDNYMGSYDTNRTFGTSQD